MLITDIRAALDDHLSPAALAWLTDALKDPEAPGWELRFASTGRHCGRAPLPGTPLTSDDAVRILLLHAIRADAATVRRLYERGDAAERRAVLHALPHLPFADSPDALPVVEDALRANDTRLIAAAVGPYAARHLDQHSWRHAVLKCVFTGVPVDAVSGLADRADPELARMLTDYARERTAAGRPVPDDVPRVIALVPPRAPSEA